jgi:hypothetical protein
MRLNACRLILLAAVACPAALGQDYGWLDTALPERAYDFGTVARGSQLRHAFPVINRTSQEIRILEWRTKCGCTDVKVGAKVIPPGTQTSVEVTVDTTRFLGHKPSGLTLIFETPSYVQVDLNTSCFIRGDIVTTPGQLDFGIVRRSEKAQTAALTIAYAGGRPDWQVTRMNTLSEHIKAELSEVGRTADGQINFSLTATLQPSAPNGYFKDEITLETSDQQKIPISVVANIQSAVALTPSIVNFGQVKAGESVTKTVLVRSAQPFSITNLSTTKTELQGDDQTKSAQAVHQVRLTLKAPDQPGAFHSVMTVKTDIPDEPEAVLKTFATVGP